MAFKRLPKTFIVGCCTVLLSLSGCKVYYPGEYCKPCVDVPAEFENNRPGIASISKWWKEFQQPQLNTIMEVALVNNLDVKQAWSRLAQARASACIVNSARYPEVNLNTAAEWRSDVNRITNFESSNMNYFLSPTLSYEIDLWRRIDSLVKAAELNVLTAFEDLETTALVLTGTVTNLWFIIQEQKSLIDLISYQIEVSETLLDLVELRFAVGESSALDVYQQRLQLEDVRATLIPVKARLKTASYQLSVLLGEPPEEYNQIAIGITGVELPEFPNIGTPEELIARRPDLRSAHYSVKSADYEVAAAIADIFPKLTLPTSYELKTREWSCLFQEEIFRIAARLVTPIIDGCRRKCEVYRRKAIVSERLDRFGQRFLIALDEVEEAIVNEEAQIDLLNQLHKQIDIAEKNLKEARIRNSMGLDDYLTVISAIQSLQSLQRRMIVEHRRLLESRSGLYRALGAPCLVGCSSYDDEAIADTCNGESYE